MNLRIEPVGPFQTNCLVLAGTSPHVLIVDPGAEADRLLACIKREQWKPAAYLITHGHVDHLSAVADLADVFPAPILIHPLELPWAFAPTNAVPPFFSSPRPPAAPLTFIQDSQRLTLANLSWVVLHTPGHSPGCVCFHFESEKMLISGDTLFRDSVGRTDLEGADPRQLAASLRRLAALPPETRVLPGHGEETTIGRELRVNPFLRECAQRSGRP